MTGRAMLVGSQVCLGGTQDCLSMTMKALITRSCPRELILLRSLSLSQLSPVKPRMEGSDGRSSWNTRKVAEAGRCFRKVCSTRLLGVLTQH